MALLSITASKNADCSTVTLSNVFSSGALALTGETAATATLTVYNHKTPTVTTSYDVVSSAAATSAGLTVSGDNLTFSTTSWAVGIWYFQFSYTYDSGASSAVECFCVALDCSLITNILSEIDSAILQNVTTCDHCQKVNESALYLQTLHDAMQTAIECQQCNKAADLYDYLTFKADGIEDCIGC